MDTKKSINIDIDELIKNYENIIERIYKIASDPNTDQSTLEKLSMLSDSYILSGIILNPKVSSDILERLLDLHSDIGGTDEETRIHIIYNPALREVILNRLSEKDRSPIVREAALSALAKRMSIDPNADPEQLLGLYYIIRTKPSVSDGKRQEQAIKELLNHPKFPHNRVQG